VVDVRLRGSLSARSAVPNRLPLFSPLLLVFLLQQPNSKEVTSLGVEYAFIILLISSRFPPFLVYAVPKVLDLAFLCFVDAVPYFPFHMTSS
jgi:hypothetical protein